MVTVKLEQFEGPLALLVKLIDKAELDITQVSLAKVADQYLEHLHGLADVNPEEMADFLTVASRLLLIKSKALLPYLLPEEEEAIEEFEDQLRMYREFLEATKRIESMVATKRFMYVREFSRQALIAAGGFFAPPRKIKPADLAAVFKEFLASLEDAEEKLGQEVMRVTVSLEEKIGEMKQAVKRLVQARFSEFIKTAGSKAEIVVSFLAVLELVKLNYLAADQSALFAEIELRRHHYSYDTP